MKTRLCFLNVQPHMLLVGQPGGFSTAEDFHKFAAQECGFTGITMPSGFLNLRKAIKSQTYRDEFQAGLINCGLTDGLVRMEMHVDGQNVCLHPARARRFGHFINGQSFRHMSHRQLERTGAARVVQAIDASAAFGFKDLPGFEGGRGFPAAMAKWSAWPKHLAPWVMALLAYKWIPLLEYSADRGVTITFEIGHPENDLLTGGNFVMFFQMLTSKARKGVGVNADWSHFLNIGIHPMPHMTAAAKTGCRFSNHYKWGAVVERGQGAASMYGGWEEWSHASTTFFTFATVGPDSLARDFHRFNVARAKAQGDKVLDVVYEGEDATIMDPKQAMRIGADNCRAAIDGKPFIKVTGIVDNGDAGFTLTHPSKKRSKAQIVGANGQPMALKKWAGGPFDAAFDSPLKPYELLEMSPKEVAACRLILERAGFAEAAAVGMKAKPAPVPAKPNPKKETARIALSPKPAPAEPPPIRMTQASPPPETMGGKPSEFFQPVSPEAAAKAEQPPAPQQDTAPAEPAAPVAADPPAETPAPVAAGVEPGTPASPADLAAIQPELPEPPVELGKPPHTAAAVAAAIS